MSILLTGANGFIGKQITHINNDVVTVSTVHKKADFYIDDLDDTVNWVPILDGVEKVIHLANLAHADFSEDEYQRINIDGSLHLVREAIKAGVKRFVYLSSVSVYGNQYEHINHSLAYQPLTKASKSKVKFEEELIKLTQSSQMEVVIVRAPLVYGPNAPGNFGLLIKLVSTTPVLPFGLINNKRDFISVYNLSELLLTCANHPDAGGHIFLVSDTEPVSIKDFTTAIAKGLGKKTIQLPVPVFLMRLVGSLINKSTMVEQLVGDLQVDSSCVREVLNWTPPYTMEESMASLLIMTNEKRNK